MNLFFEILLIFTASFILVLARFALLRLNQPTTLPLWMIKVLTSAASPLLLLLGLLITVTGIIFSSTIVTIIAGLGVILFFAHIVQITRPPDAAPGLKNIAGKNFLNRRYVFWLRKSPAPIFEQNIPFYTIPGTNRSLLCDMWQPLKNTRRSGLTFIYLHGSAWAVLDKDFGTRTFFRHLAFQGHVIMDVAHRLFPEADFLGMVHDTKHAIAWMKANAANYGINPQRIIIGGGSAGAHLALLAAYTNSNNQLTPVDLAETDVSVHGVISLYGQSDLAATYYHTAQHLITHSSLGKQKDGKPGGLPPWIQKSMGKNFHRLGFDKNVEPGMLVPMLGGTPDTKREAYALFSPITHVHESCPETLLIHGKQDILAPVNAIRRLYTKLKKRGVPVAMHLLPQTDHAFDLILPRISPSSQNALYDIERFLAAMAIKQDQNLPGNCFTMPSVNISDMSRISS
jgi:acetyl esterase/lipase